MPSHGLTGACSCGCKPRPQTPLSGNRRRHPSFPQYPALPRWAKLWRVPQKHLRSRRIIRDLRFREPFRLHRSPNTGPGCGSRAYGAGECRVRTKNSERAWGCARSGELLARLEKRDSSHRFAPFGMTVSVGDCSRMGTECRNEVRARRAVPLQGIRRGLGGGGRGELPGRGGARRVISAYAFGRAIPPLMMPT